MWRIPEPDMYEVLSIGQAKQPGASAAQKMLAMMIIEEREIRTRFANSAIPPEAHPAFHLNARKQAHWNHVIERER